MLNKKALKKTVRTLIKIDKAVFVGLVLFKGSHFLYHAVKNNQRQDNPSGKNEAKHAGFIQPVEECPVIHTQLSDTEEDLAPSASDDTRMIHISGQNEVIAYQLPQSESESIDDKNQRTERNEAFILNWLNHSDTEVFKVIKGLGANKITALEKHRPYLSLDAFHEAPNKVGDEVFDRMIAYLDVEGSAVLHDLANV